jgi:transcriptional regulator with XRE-family HTH domain
MFYKTRKPYPNLKAKREALGMNIAQFARFVGVSDATISKAESGKPVSEDVYRWIGEALNG